MVGRLAGIKYAFAKPMGGPDRPPPALTSRGGRWWSAARSPYDAAIGLLARTRDVLTWQRDMGQLDAEEEAARQPIGMGRVSGSEVVAYLRSLPALWADSGPDGRQALALALFARTEVIGFEQMSYQPIGKQSSLASTPHYRPCTNSRHRLLSLVGARGVAPTHRPHLC